MSKPRKPDPVMLNSGEILVTFPRDDGSLGMTRVDPDDATYPGWLVRVQDDVRRSAVSVINRGLWRYTFQAFLVWLVLVILVGAILLASGQSVNTQ